jgi:hypothetical protein
VDRIILRNICEHLRYLREIIRFSPADNADVRRLFQTIRKKAKLENK